MAKIHMSAGVRNYNFLCRVLYDEEEGAGDDDEEVSGWSDVD